MSGRYVPRHAETVWEQLSADTWAAWRDGLRSLLGALGRVAATRVCADGVGAAGSVQGVDGVQGSVVLPSGDGPRPATGPSPTP